MCTVTIEEEPQLRVTIAEDAVVTAELDDEPALRVTIEEECP